MVRPPDAQLTHLGLSVSDVDAMVGFYQSLLGLEISDRGAFQGRRIVFLTRDPGEHHQLVLVSGRPRDAGYSPVTQISFRVPSLEDLQFFHEWLRELAVRELRGADHGNAWSLYFLDPEGNRVEMYTPTPWYVNQPYQTPLDLGLPAHAIRAGTEAAIAHEPSLLPQARWEQAMAARLAGEGGSAIR
jgi:catechol 2,3-dioxygenase